MRQQGRLTEWNDVRGFGFVTPLTEGPRVFVHISEFPRGERRPIVDDLVTYNVSVDDLDRSRATGVLYLIPTRSVAATASKWVSVATLVVVLGAALAFGDTIVRGLTHTWASLVPATPASASSDDVFDRLFREQRSGIQASGKGTVAKVLADDNDGGRHQRFILRLASGQTLLLAHNIDIAPRLPGLTAGDSVGFNGVYEWNSQGGVVHWTHHDPSGRHLRGWLMYNGSMYQ